MAVSSSSAEPSCRYGPLFQRPRSVGVSTIKGTSQFISGSIEGPNIVSKKGACRVRVQRCRRQLSQPRDSNKTPPSDSIRLVQKLDLEVPRGTPQAHPTLTQSRFRAPRLSSHSVQERSSIILVPPRTHVCFEILHIVFMTSAMSRWQSTSPSNELVFRRPSPRSVKSHT